MNSFPETVDLITEQGVSGETDLIRGKLSFSSGTESHIDVSRISRREPNISAMALTQSDEAYYMDDSSIFRFDKVELDYEKIFERDREPLTVECRRFVDTIENNEAPVTDGEFAVGIHNIIEEFKRIE